MPIARLENGSWPHPARLPLGGVWCGHCTAPGHEGEAPQKDVLENCCNLGYASGCTWPPTERVWDAVRFAVSAPLERVERSKSQSGATTAGVTARVLVLRYVCERDHRPVVHGDLEYDLPSAMWVRPHDDARIQKMAGCFLESYLKKKA